MRKLLICASAVLAAGACAPQAGNETVGANAASPAPETAAMTAPMPSLSPIEYLRSLLGADGRTNIATAETDLNGDGVNEFIVYVSGQEHCGSGGCRILVLNERDGAWRTAMDASVSRLPLRLLDTSTNGWRDLGVTTGGGGVARGLARMRFNGTFYPDNPTAPPAAGAGLSEGTILIAEDAQGRPLL